MSEIQDTEITLGTSKLLAIFFALVMLCAVFFGLGFSMGRNSAKGTFALQETATPTNGSGTTVKSSPAARQIAANSSDAPPAATQAAENPPAASSEPPTDAKPDADDNKPPAMNGTGYIVQVAAVSKQEDADALVSALKKKQYPVFVASGPASQDKLFHVQIGPFGDMKDAEATKSKLLGDGYNPIVKR